MFIVASPNEPTNHPNAGFARVTLASPSFLFNNAEPLVVLAGLRAQGTEARHHLLPTSETSSGLNRTPACRLQFRVQHATRQVGGEVLGRIELRGQSPRGSRVLRGAYNPKGVGHYAQFAGHTYLC